METPPKPTVQVRESSFLKGQSEINLGGSEKEKGTLRYEGERLRGHWQVSRWTISGITVPDWGIVSRMKDQTVSRRPGNWESLYQDKTLW